MAMHGDTNGPKIRSCQGLLILLPGLQTRFHATSAMDGLAVPASASTSTSSIASISADRIFQESSDVQPWVPLRTLASDTLANSFRHRHTGTTRFRFVPERLSPHFVPCHSSLLPGCKYNQCRSRMHLLPKCGLSQATHSSNSVTSCPEKSWLALGALSSPNQPRHQELVDYIGTS